MRAYQVTTQQGMIVASDASQIAHDITQLLVTADVGGTIDLSVQVINIELDCEAKETGSQNVTSQQLS
jgi:hypothetical protein